MGALQADADALKASAAAERAARASLELARQQYQLGTVSMMALVTVASLPQPVICAVQGHCSTGAIELALAADLIVAAESARFCDAYARCGLTPIWGLSLRLPHRVGTSKASEMMYTCRSYSGAQAHDMHLANFCFRDDQFEAHLAALAADIPANSQAAGVGSP